MRLKLGEIVEKDGKLYKRVAPDGGWGFIIGTGMVLVMVTTYGPMFCFAMLYQEFFETYNIGSKEVGLQSGIGCLCFSFSAFFCGLALKRYSIRQVGIFGAVLFSLGTFVTIFMSSLLEFIIGCAFIGAIGIGFMVNCIFTAFNMYFDKKKTFYMGIFQTINAILSILFPQFVKWSLGEFGWRGTLAILCGLTMQNIVVFALVHPVDQHLKLEEISPEEQVELKPLTKSKEEEAEEIKKNTITPEIILNDKKPTKSKLKDIIQLFDLNLLKDFSYVNACIGLSFGILSDLLLLTFFPMYLSQTLNWDQGQVAFMLMLMTVGDSLGRFFLSLVSSFFKLTGMTMFLSGIAGVLIFRVAMFTSTDVTFILCAMTVYGFFRSVFLVTPALIIAQLVPAEKFAAANGLQQFLMGIFNLVTGTAAGALKDATGSYVYSFHVLTIVVSICLMSLLIEVLCRRKK